MSKPSAEAKFVIRKTSNGKYYSHFSRSHSVLMSSEMYETKIAALNALAVVKKYANTDLIEDLTV